MSPVDESGWRRDRRGARAVAGTGASGVIPQSARLAGPGPGQGKPLFPRPPETPPDLGAAQDLLLREMVADGKMTEVRMLDILAPRLGVQRVPLSLLPPDPDLDDLLPPQLCLRHALVPWKVEAGRLTVATAYPETARNLAAILPGECKLAPPVLATRAEIQSILAERHRPALTRAMSERVDEAESFRSYRPSPRIFAVLLMLFAAAATAAIAAPALFFAILLAWALITLTVASGVKGTATLVQLSARHRAEPPPVPTGTLPVISILVPMFRERHIAEHLVRRLERLDYPRGRLDVILVLEENDRLTAQALERASLPPWMRVVTVPDGRPRTKPRAMNYALDFCRGDIVGIYDAEDAPDHDQLLRVAAHFAAAPPDVACLQGQLDYYNPRQNWIARCFTIEYNAWFRLILPGMARMGWAVPLGGTTLFVRRDVLEAVGGWDAHNVTEDADLGFRLARHGWSTRVIDTTTGEEANCLPVRWIRQRSRWLKGYMVTYAVQMRRPVRLLRGIGPWRFLGMQLHFITALSQFILAPVLWSFWGKLLGLGHPMDGVMPAGALIAVTGLLLVAELVNMAIGAVALRRSPHRWLWPWLPAMTIYYTMACFAAYKALFEMVVVPFYWDKTSHGISLAVTPGPATPQDQRPVTPARPKPNRA
ncbi:MAG: glycosyltransferase family 2 protein [Pseudooceanicola sp.]